MLVVEVKPVIEQFRKTLGILISSLTTSAGLTERYSCLTGVKKLRAGQRTEL
jgi:hypothetical protein